MSDRGARMISAAVVTASGVAGVGMVCVATSLPNGQNGGVVLAGVVLALVALTFAILLLRDWHGSRRGGESA